MSAMLMVFMMIMLAFAVDIGYLLTARTELQRSADSAALAAAWDYVDEGSFSGDPNLTTAITSARGHASEYAGLNSVARAAPLLDTNLANSLDGDIVLGYLSNFSDPSAVFQVNNPADYNAVTVRVRRQDDWNGLVPMFFARILGINGSQLEAEATAALAKQIGGFQIPGDGSNLGILPFALDEDTWNDLLAGNASDDFSWDADTGTASSGSDGIQEVNLYPQGTDSPGNRGTVDIGGSNNSTKDIARQITDGVSESDLEHLDGKIELDENGELFLNGDTGISAGVKDELTSIIGKPRVIPIFRTVVGPGNNATYTIVGFAGIRIMEVKLTGNMSGKRVIIQPAPMVIKGTIPSNSDTTSYLVFSPAYLIR